MGPSSPASSAQDCCTQCAAAKDCACATYVLPGTCWFKNATQCGLPGYNSGATGCWPSGTPPPNPPFVPSCDSGLPYETHGYNQHGEGFKTVNSGASLQPFSPNVPPSMPTGALTGAACPGTYASEFGGVAVSSFESLAPTLNPGDWGLHTVPMAQVGGTGSGAESPWRET